MESCNPGQLEMNLTLDSNNVFRRSLVIEVNNDEVEIPVIARGHFESWFQIIWLIPQLWESRG